MKVKIIVIVVLVFSLFTLIIAPFTVFGGMKAYADECVSAANELSKTVNDIPEKLVEGVKKEYGLLTGYKNLKISNPVTNGFVSSDFNTVDSAHAEPHNGTDFASSGDAYAVTDGVVVASGFDDARGFYVAVAFKSTFGQNYTYLYQHMAQVNATIGERIVSGQKLGKIGNTGMSKGVHLHAEVEYADMTKGYPRWRGTYPTNAQTMFNIVEFFGLGRSFDGVADPNIPPKQSFKKCAASGVVTNLEGNTNAEKIWNALIKEGFTKEATAGIIGNLMQESSCDPKASQSDGAGRGIMQWGYNGDGGRFNSLMKWAQSQGLDEWALETQVSWMFKELKEYGVYDQIKPMTSIHAAVELFEIKMEAAGIPRMEARYKYAIDAYAKFNK